MIAISGHDEQKARLGSRILTRPAGKSFASVLANGQTTSGIAQKRALGFSETGLFGTGRAQLPEKTAPMPMVGRLAKPPLVAKSFTTDSASSVLLRNCLHVRFVAADVESDALAFASRDREQETKPSDGGSFISYFAGGGALAEPKADLLSGPRPIPVGSAVRLPKYRINAENVHLVEEGEGLSVLLSEVEQNGTIIKNVMREILQAGADYGVTFRRVGLNWVWKNLADSQCEEI